MSDYDENDSESEARSDTSEGIERDYQDVESDTGEDGLENLYNDLLNEKLRLFIAFNEGTVNVNDYLFNISRINRNLNEAQYTSREIQQDIIKKETELRTLLDTYEGKIEGQIETLPKNYDDSLKRNVLSPEELKIINILKYQIDDLMEKSKIFEEDDEPFQSNRLYDEWVTSSDLEKGKIVKFLKRDFPIRENFKNNDEFLNAQDEFLNDANIWFKSYWEPYLEKEKKEIKSAKKTKKELPGYIYKTGITKPGGSYEKVDFISEKEKAGLLKKKIEDIPIRLSEEDERYSKQFTLYNKLLGKLDRNHLVSCIDGTTLFKPSNNVVLMDPEIIPVSLRLKKLSGKPIPLNQLITGRQSSKKKLIKSLNSVKIPELKILRKENVRKENVIVDNVIDKVDLLENYIFKITKDTPQFYYTKIKDILFIFDHYPEFKIKFLQGAINIYQLALFENLLTQDKIIHIYPVSLEKRKGAIQKIIKTIYIATYNIKRLRKSEILTKYIITKKSKELERFIFDLVKNEREYISKLGDLIDFINENKSKVFSIKPEDLLTKNKIIEDFKDPDYNELRALILQEQYNLQELEKKLRLLKSKNYMDNYVIFWKLPNNVSKEETKQWNDTLKLVNEQLEKQGKNENFLLNEKNKILSINKLNNQHFNLIKKYNLEFIPGVEELNKNIQESQEHLNVLNKKRVTFEIEKINNWRNNYKNMLERKFGPKSNVPERPLTKIIYPKSNVNELTIGQLVQTVKRKIIKNEKIHELLELYDLNELNNKTTVKYNNENIRTFPKETIFKIKNYLIVEIEKINSSNFNLINNTSLELAINEVSKLIHIPQIKITTADAAIKYLTDNWPQTWNGEVFLDIYGENVFEKLLKINSPFDFYTNYYNYSSLVKRFTPPDIPVYTKPRTMFNGVMYDVEYLDKDWGTGQPLNAYKQELQKNPRTGLFEVISKISKRRGKYPFILRNVRTEQEGKTKEIWTEVETGKVKYQVTNFGKKTKIKLVLKKNVKFVYKLSDTPSKRHSQIHKRILAEKKKKKTTLRKAAVAFKRRLVVLRTYNKIKSPKAYFILNSDINYISKKYLKKIL